MRLRRANPKPIPVATRDRDGEPYRIYHPRLAAIDLLREKIADKQAGLDPYDHALLIVNAGQHETVWAYRAIELVGKVLTISLHGDGRRYAALIEADVRHELGLDTPDPPLMADEPLASRGVERAALLLIDATEKALPMGHVLREVH